MDYSAYSPDWKDIIRPAILRRDNYRCSICGIEHKSRVYKNSRDAYVVCDEFTEQWAKAHDKKVFTLYLQVAHLDHDKSNNEYENLLTLCPMHHAKNDAEHKKMSRIIFKEKGVQKASISRGSELEKRKQLINETKQFIKELTTFRIDRFETEQLINFIENKIKNNN